MGEVHLAQHLEVVVGEWWELEVRSQLEILRKKVSRFDFLIADR